MADEASTIWGAQEEEGGSPTQTPALDAEQKPAPRLFDDLGDADWGLPERDQTPFATEQPTPILAAEANVEPATEDVFHEPESDFEPGIPPSDSGGFEDFKEGANAVDDDDFGDFGDFDEHSPGHGFESLQEEPVVQSDSGEWHPLSITPNTTASSLAHDIRNLLSPPFSDGRMYPYHDGAASQLSQDQVRQVEGPSQVLVREESRQVYSALTQQPNLIPVDWMRSNTRRQYLIAVGVPINLDELNSTAANGSKSLPPLALTLDKSSAADEGEGSRKASKERETYKPPAFDSERAKAVTSMTEDQLTLLSLPALRDLQREMEGLTRQASGVLTHYLSQREAHSADAEMYNGLIRDLVTGAAKRVSASNATSASRRVSVRRGGGGSNNLSGRNSPAVGAAAAARSSSPRV